MADLLQEAWQHHKAGRLDVAETAYQAILHAQPDHADALHLLGVIAHQRGNPARAAELIAQAIAINPQAAAFHFNMAEVCRELGRLDQTIEHLQTTITLNPRYAEAWNNLGATLLARGRLDEAIDDFRHAIEVRNEYPMAHNNLGSALRQKRQLDAAAAEFRRAVELDPAFAGAYSNLGQTLLELRKNDEALTCCRRAVELDPACCEAQNNLGNVLRELGQRDEAKACYAAALQIRPGLAITCNNMGQVLEEEDNLNEAVRWFERAVQLDPASALFVSSLGGALEALDRFEQAVAQYRRAIQLDPSCPEAHNGLGHALIELGRCDEAMQPCEEAIRLKPELPVARVNHGRLLMELGNLKAAEAEFREALKHDPRLPAAYTQLAETLGKNLPPEDAEAMRDLLTNPRLGSSHRQMIHARLAQFHDAHGEYHLAAQHAREASTLEKANRQKRGEGYDPATRARFVDRMIAGFTPEFFQSVRGWGLESDVPVFIIGMPRSGTTLFEQILASHPQAFGAGELSYMREAFRTLPARLNLAAPPVDCIPALTRGVVQSLAAQHIERLRKLNPDRPRIVDKMPDNYIYLGLIATLLPNARIIHCRRNPRDVAVSCWITPFRSVRWACDEEWIATRIRDYRRLMDHWRKVLPLPILEMNYEDVVADLEPCARRLVEWCGLDWDPACLAFHEGKRRVRTASLVQVRKPIYASSVARWRHYEHDLARLFALLPDP